MKSLVRILFVFCLVWILSRSAIYLLPGDPAEYLVHESLVQTTTEALKQKMDIKDSVIERIFSLPKARSLIKDTSALTLVTHALKNSFILTLITLCFSTVITLGALVWSFKSPTARIATTLGTGFISSVPLFVSGPIILYFFCIQLRLVQPFNSPTLPALALALYLSSFWYKVLQQSLDHYQHQSAATGARARGLSENTVFFKYLLSPVFGSFLAYFGTQIGTLLNGSLLVEMIFQWNGISSLLAEAVLSRDYPVIELSLLFLTMITLLAQQGGYWLQSKWEPRMS